jgi:hypothetical protein
MHVAFVASHQLVRTVMTGGFGALPPGVAVGGKVLVREGGPSLTRALDGNAAIVLEMPDDLVSRFARAGGEDGDPRTFALPTGLADRLPVLAYRVEGLPALPPAPPQRRFPRGLVAGAAALAAAGIALGLFLLLDDGGGDESDRGRQDRAAGRQPANRPANPQPRTTPKPAARPRSRSRAIGTPSNGRLVRGVPLPPKGEHFFTWNIPRETSPNSRARRYGTDVVVRRVLRAVAAYGRAHPRAPRVGIADLSLPRGGFFGTNYGGSGHTGHQNGTEVDVLYPRKDGKERAADSLDQVDRRLTQDLLDRFLAAGALHAVVDPRLGLRAPAAKLGYKPLHEEHIHLRFPRR